MYTFRADAERAKRTLRVTQGLTMVFSVDQLRDAAVDTRYFHDARGALAESLAQFVAGE